METTKGRYLIQRGDKFLTSLFLGDGAFTYDFARAYRYNAKLVAEDVARTLDAKVVDSEVQADIYNAMCGVIRAAKEAFRVAKSPTLRSDAQKTLWALQAERRALAPMLCE